MPLQGGMTRAEERLAELVHDSGPAQLRERVGGRPRGDDRAVRKRLPGAVVVGDHDVEPEGARLGDLLHGGDSAVHGQHEADTVAGETREGVARDAVALLEAAREVPVGLGAQLAQDEDGERRRADAVDVIVAVDADALAALDGGPDPLDRHAHVAEQERVVARKLGVEEAAGVGGLAVPAPDEHRCGDLAHAELANERGDGLMVLAVNRPDTRHPEDGTGAAGRLFAQDRDPLARGSRSREDP